MRLTPHSKYKPSGVEWLGDVPEDWHVRRGRFCMEVNPRSNRLRTLKPEDEVSFVPMEAIGEFGGLQLEQTRAIADVGSGYTEFEDGDVVVAKITPCFENGKGALAARLVNGVAFGTTELHILRATALLERRFLFYFTMSRLFRSTGEGEMYGAGGQKRVPPEFCENVRVPLPSLDDQRIIADFLDRETAKIDRLVVNKQTLIERLKEKRTALISRTVTRGLPPDAARAAGFEPHPTLKPSGIEWLGEIPEHWRVCPIKGFARSGRRTFTDGDWIELPFITDDGVRLIQTGNIGIGEYREQGFRYISEDSFRDLGCTEVQPNDILICRLDGPVGRACLAPDLGVRMVTSVDNTIVKVRDGISPKFVVYLLSSGPWLNWVDALCRVGGGFRLRISRTMLGNNRAPSPPFDEQSAIVDFLDRETKRIDAMVVKVETAIERLQEYRIALITAATTGKIDVRGVTA